MREPGHEVIHTPTSYDQSGSPVQKVFTPQMPKDVYYMATHLTGVWGYRSIAKLYGYSITTIQREGRELTEYMLQQTRSVCW
jgi:hypothetical protein